MNPTTPFPTSSVQLAVLALARTSLGDAVAEALRRRRPKPTAAVQPR